MSRFEVKPLVRKTAIKYFIWPETFKAIDVQAAIRRDTHDTIDLTVISIALSDLVKDGTLHRVGHLEYVVGAKPAVAALATDPEPPQLPDAASASAPSDH